MDKIQKIREEVERIQLYTQSEVLKQVLDYIDKVQKEPINEDFEKTFISMVNATHEHNGSYSLHDFAQRLYNIAKEELKEPVSEDLEEAAYQYANCFKNQFEMASMAFIKGAKWQKEQEYTCYEEAFEDGAKWKYEQMVKDAHECEVKVDAGGYPYIAQIELYDYDKDEPLAKEGDKYKVILVEEE